MSPLLFCAKKFITQILIIICGSENKKGDFTVNINKPVLDTEDIIIDIIVLIGDILKS